VPTLFSSYCFGLGIEPFVLVDLLQMETANSATAKVAPHCVRFACRAFRCLFAVRYFWGC
jgi:hypothetical protein